MVKQQELKNRQRDLKNIQRSRTASRPTPNVVQSPTPKKVEQVKEPIDKISLGFGLNQRLGKKGRGDLKATPEQIENAIQRARAQLSEARRKFNSLPDKKRGVPNTLKDKLIALPANITGLRENLKIVQQTRNTGFSREEIIRRDSKNEARARSAQARKTEEQRASVTTPKNTGAPIDAIEAEKQRFIKEQGRLKQGVFVTQSGSSVVVREGKNLKISEQTQTRGSSNDIRRTNGAGNPSVSIVSGDSGFTPQGRISAAKNENLKILGVIKIPLKESFLSSPERFSQQAKRFRNVNPKKSGEAEFKEFTSAAVRGLIFPFVRPKEFAQSLVQLVTHPIKTTKETAKAFGDRPATIAGELLGTSIFFKGATKTVGTATKATQTAATIADPRFRPAIPSEVTGQSAISTITNIITTKGKKNIQIVGAIGSKSLPGESLAKQAARAGTIADPVSAARNLFSPIRKEVIVNKPTPPNSPPLEKALFADPESRARPTRLGLTQKTQSASLTDIATGNFQIIPDRPQIIILPEQIIQQFPRKLQDIAKNLKQGKPLTKAQQQRLEAFQLSKTGGFKTPGFLSPESEVVLAPGEILKSEGTKAVTLIKKEGSLLPSRVPIIEASIKPSQRTTISSSGLPTLKEPSSPPSTKPVLSPLVSESPFIVAASSKSPSIPQKKSPIINPTPKKEPETRELISKPQPDTSILGDSTTSSDTRTTPSADTSTQPSQEPSPPQSPIKPSSPSPTSPIPPNPSSPTSTPPTNPSPISTPPRKRILKFTGPSPSFNRPKTNTPITTPKKSQKKKKKTLFGEEELVEEFRAFLKVKGRFTPVGIGSKKQATFLGARASKASLAATFRVRPTGRRINKPKREPSLRGLGKIFREATIRKGKPIPTPGQFIEKRGKRLTTRKEVSLLQAARKRKSSGGFFKKSGRGVVL